MSIVLMVAAVTKLLLPLSGDSVDECLEPAVRRTNFKLFLMYNTSNRDVLGNDQQAPDNQLHCQGI